MWKYTSICEVIPGVFGIRHDIANRFDSPNLMIATSSMNKVLASADKAEAVAGNVSANSKELTIVGGSATATGHSWVYWNLPETATKVYITATEAVNADAYIDIDLCDADASTFSNPPDYYIFRLIPGGASSDLQIHKVVSGTVTQLASEAVDITADRYYKIEVYFEGDGSGNNVMKCYRDGVLKFDVSDTEVDIPSIAAVRFRVYDNSTESTQEGKFKGMVVIVYE